MQVFQLFFRITICIFVTLPATAQSTIQFKVSDVKPPEGHQVGIRGNKAPLSWDQSVSLDKQGDGYATTLTFAETEGILEFKFVTFDNEDQANWESNSNRKLKLKGESATSSHVWDMEQYIDPTTVPPIEVAGLMEDYALLEQMVLDIHPGTYRYLDSAGVKGALSVLEQSFQQPLTHGEAYLAINKMLAKIQCAHTFASLYNQNSTVQSVIHLGKDKLPFAFRWIEDQMVVTHDATSTGLLTTGTVIRSINGHSIEEIVDQILPFISRDGNTPANQKAQLEVLGYDFQYYAFDAYFSLLYAPRTSVTLEITDPQGLSSTIEVSLTTRYDRNKQFLKRYQDFPRIQDDLWGFEVIDANSAKLTLNSFALMGWKSLSMDYKQFLYRSFDEVKTKNIKNLLVDIRLNNGGNDEILGELLTYFDVDRIRIEDMEGRTRYRSYPETLKAHTRSWGGPEPWYYNLKADKASDGYYHFPKDGLINQKNKKKPNYFKGNVFLLTSSHNASLAYYTNKSFRLLNIGHIIGEETGGNLRGINGGQIVFLTLPNSGITIDFPVMGMFAYTEQPDRGILPDELVSQSYQDFIEQIDTQQQFVLEQLINNQ